MKFIEIYDCDKERIDRICEDRDMTARDLIELLLDNLEDDEYEILG